ncbi:unnamed protein product [Clonostachys rosea]|uniref:Uncharacterized protein n=1 Tax=Bionectria ochroleuca TaxID=29856 RepID=A0ABY6UTG9_BIOOC|nr:unnamed protein product [Clonostachys rosea]
MTENVFITDDDGATIAVPATMIWVFGRWTIIIHTDNDIHHPMEVRVSFLNVIHLLDFSIFYPNTQNYPFFTLEQDGTFQPLVTDFQYVPTNHILVQVPGSGSSWLIEIPESPLRPLNTSSLNNLSIFNASVPDNDFRNVIDPRLLEGSQGQNDLPQTELSNSSSVGFKPSGATQESLEGKDSMTNNDNLGLSSYYPTENLMDQQPFTSPECSPSTPVRPGSPETNHSASPPSVASIEERIEHLKRRRALSSNCICRPGRPRSSCASKKRALSRAPARSEFTVSNDDRLMVSLDRDLRDELLIRGRLMGFSYNEIKESAGMTDALTTLRGRYSSLLRRMAQQYLKNKKNCDDKNKKR